MKNLTGLHHSITNHLQSYGSNVKAFTLREGGPSNDRPEEIEGALAVIYLFIYLFIKLRQKIITVIISNDIHIHGRITTTDKPITADPKIDKISKIKATLGLEKERLDGKAKTGRRRC